MIAIVLPEEEGRTSHPDDWNEIAGNTQDKRNLCFYIIDLFSPVGREIVTKKRFFHQEKAGKRGGEGKKQ